MKKRAISVRSDVTAGSSNTPYQVPAGNSDMFGQAALIARINAVTNAAIGR